MKKKRINKISAEFTAELEQLINKYSLEGRSNTPDYILAEYLTMCLKAYNKTLQKREAWFEKPVDNVDAPVQPKRPTMEVGKKYYITTSDPNKIYTSSNPFGTICKCAEDCGNNFFKILLIDNCGKKIDDGCGGWLVNANHIDFNEIE